jgi:hypothetical protein
VSGKHHRLLNKFYGIQDLSSFTSTIEDAVKTSPQIIYAKKIERDGKATIWIAIWRYRFESDSRFVATRHSTMRFLQTNFFDAGLGATPDTARVAASIRAIAPITRSTHHIKIDIGIRELFNAVLDFSRDGLGQSDVFARELAEFLAWDLQQWDGKSMFSDNSQHHIYLLIAAKWRCG